MNKYEHNTLFSTRLILEFCVIRLTTATHPCFINLLLITFVIVAFKIQLKHWSLNHFFTQATRVSSQYDGTLRYVRSFKVTIV